MRGLPFCFTYIDDLLIASPDEKNQHTHLRQLFTRPQDYSINSNKSVLGMLSLNLLGHSISSLAIASPLTKCEAIQRLLKPSTKQQLKELLEMVNYYNRFIPRCLLHVHPLYSILKPCKKSQSVTLDWTPEVEAALYPPRTPSPQSPLSPLC